MPRPKGSKNKAAGSVAPVQQEAVETKEPEVPKVVKRQVAAIPKELMDNIIITGDLSRLSADQKTLYYRGYCERVGLDPVTKPFDLLSLNGKQILYCTRSGTQQLSALHKVSHQITDRRTENGVILVSCRATSADGRFSESIGAVPADGKGAILCNNYMKAETKAKRRATLDLLGLGILDESELETIPGARVAPSVTHVEAHSEEFGADQVSEPDQGQVDLVRKKIAHAISLLRETEFTHTDKLDAWWEQAKSYDNIQDQMRLYKDVLAAGGVHKTYMVQQILEKCGEMDEAELVRLKNELKAKQIKEVYSAYVDAKNA